jgi:hypothetical protein
MTMDPAPMVYNQGRATCSGNFLLLRVGQPDVPTLVVTDRTLSVEENGDAVLAQTAIGVARDHVPALAAGDFSDVPSPTTTVTGSGALLAKNAVLHISLSTLKTWVAGKIATA